MSPPRLAALLGLLALGCSEPSAPAPRAEPAPEDRAPAAPAPAPPPPQEAPPPEGWVAPRVHVAGAMRCALDAQGEVACAARPGGPATHRLGSVVDLVAGAEHVCAQRTDGTVWCWGSNARGALGVPPRDLAASDTPLRLAPRVRRVSAAGDETCLAGADRRVRCRLGSDPALRRVEGLEQVSDVASLEGAHCAITRDGDVACWGDPESGGLGQPRSTATGDVAATEPPIRDAVAIAAGGRTACVIRGEDRTVSCWGRDLLAAADAAPLETPTAIPGVRGARAIAVARSAACVVTATRELICWGTTDASAPPRAPSSLARDVPEQAHLVCSAARCCARAPLGESHCVGAPASDD